MVTAADTYKPQRRLWLVFFTNTNDWTWWTRFLAPGFRHVSAAAWYDAEQRWVYVDPTRRGLVIELWTEDEFGRRLGQLIRDSSVILRIPSAAERGSMPLISAWCVGTVKALLGVKTRALLPRQLYSHLLALGAEIVEKPSGKSAQAPEPAPGRPGSGSHAQAGAGAGRRG